MPIFVCHRCTLFVEVSDSLAANPSAIKCPKCGWGMFWKPDNLKPTLPYKQDALFTGTAQVAANPVAPTTQPAHVSPPHHEDEGEVDREFVSQMWTGGLFHDAYANAVQHWNNHKKVNGVTHTTVGSYVHSAQNFYNTYKRNKVAQAKNPRVEYVHNCGRDSTTATLLVVNIEPTSSQKYRFASFYDMTPNRNGQTLQRQLAQLLLATALGPLRKFNLAHPHV